MHRTCVALLGAAALAVAGCGGGDNDGGEPVGGADTRLTKAEFIARAAAICRDVTRAQGRYSGRIRALSRVDELKRLAPILDDALGASRQGLERLRAVRAQAPGEDRAALDAYYAAADRLLAASTQLRDATRSDDRAKARRIAARADALSDDAQRRADAYGLEDCGDAF